jgi:Ca2+-binding EF-hand superfamily protein
MKPEEVRENMDRQWTRFLTLFLMLALGTLAFTACQAAGEEAIDENDAALGDDSGLGAGNLADVVDFSAFDLNGDEALDAGEFGTFLKEAGMAGQAELDAYDRDDNGVLDENEFDEMVQDLGIAAGDLVKDTAATLQELFADLDANHDGAIDQAELEALLETQGLAGQAKLDAYDRDGDGVLDQDEFNEMAQDLGIAAGDLVKDTATTLQELFADLDANHDGAIDQAELEALLKTHGLAGQAQLDAYDHDGDGVLNQDEFDEIVQDLGLGNGRLFEDTGGASTQDSADD